MDIKILELSCLFSSMTLVGMAFFVNTLDFKGALLIFFSYVHTYICIAFCVN